MTYIPISCQNSNNDKLMTVTTFTSERIFIVETDALSPMLIKHNISLMQSINKYM